MCRTQPSTETWGSTNYCIYGTIFYMYLPHYSASLPVPPPPPKPPPTGSTHFPLHWSHYWFPHCAFRWRAHIFLVSIHARSNTSPNTPKSPKTIPPYSSAILVSFLFSICWINISLRPDEVALVCRSVKACHDLIMILLCFSTTRFYLLYSFLLSTES